jgi:hypothetical protein
MGDGSHGELLEKSFSLLQPSGSGPRRYYFSLFAVGPLAIIIAVSKLNGTHFR